MKHAETHCYDCGREVIVQTPEPEDVTVEAIERNLAQLPPERRRDVEELICTFEPGGYLDNEQIAQRLGWTAERALVTVQQAVMLGLLGGGQPSIVHALPLCKTFLGLPPTSESFTAFVTRCLDSQLAGAFFARYGGRRPPAKA